MNDRIRELFKRAGGKTSIHNLMSNPVQQREYNELWDDNITKFAELIVRDCLDVIKGELFDESNDSDPYENGYQHAVLRIQQRIEGNFGVKE